MPYLFLSIFWFMEDFCLSQLKESTQTVAGVGPPIELQVHSSDKHRISTSVERSRLTENGHAGLIWDFMVRCFLLLTSNVEHKWPLYVCNLFKANYHISVILSYSKYYHSRARASCKCHLSSQWEHPNLGSRHPKTISAIKMKFGTIDYVGEVNLQLQPTFVNNWITGTSPHMREIHCKLKKHTKMYFVIS